MPMAPTGVPDGHYEGDGHDHSSPGASFGDAEPAGADAVFRALTWSPTATGNGRTATATATGRRGPRPPARSPRAAAAPTLTRDLPLAPAVQRQADPAKRARGGSRASSAPRPLARPASAASARRPPAAARRARAAAPRHPRRGGRPAEPHAPIGPAHRHRPLPPAPSRTTRCPSLPSLRSRAQRTASSPSGRHAAGPPSAPAPILRGSTLPGLTLPTAQRTATDPSAAAHRPAEPHAPDGPADRQQPFGRPRCRSPQRSTTDSSDGSAAQPHAARPPSAAPAGLPALRPPTCRASSGMRTSRRRPSPSSLPLAAVPHHEAEAAVTGGADDTGDTAESRLSARPSLRRARGPLVRCTRAAVGDTPAARAHGESSVRAMRLRSPRPRRLRRLRSPSFLSGSGCFPACSAAPTATASVLRPAGEPGARRSAVPARGPGPERARTASPPPAPEPERSTTAAEPAIRCTTGTARAEPPLAGRPGGGSGRGAGRAAGRPDRSCGVPAPGGATLAGGAGIGARARGPPGIAGLVAGGRAVVVRALGRGRRAALAQPLLRARLRGRA
jgi:hypothetical protein